MHLPDAQHIYGVGRVRGPAYFVKSEDGGTNWFVTNLTTAGRDGWTDGCLFHEHQSGFHRGHGYQFLLCAALFRQHRPHDQWRIKLAGSSQLPCHQQLFLEDVLAVHKRRLRFAFSKMLPIPHSCSTKRRMAVRRGVSNGIPLSAIGSPASFELQGIGFVSTNEGWTGGGSLPPPYNMIHTTDGGLTWTPMGIYQCE